MYRGRADCEIRIHEFKANLGICSFVLRDFWATEGALGVTMLAYNHWKSGFAAFQSATSNVGKR